MRIYASTQHGSSARFFAILSPDGQLNLPFYPSKEFPERTDTYLEFVMKENIGYDHFYNDFNESEMDELFH